MGPDRPFLERGEGRKKHKEEKREKSFGEHEVIKNCRRREQGAARGEYPENPSGWNERLDDTTGKEERTGGRKARQ